MAVETEVAERPLSLIILPQTLPNTLPFTTSVLHSIGSAIYNIYKTLGYRCIGINHLGDWGTQFGQLIVAYKKWGSENTHKSYTVTDLNNLYVKFHQEAEKNTALEDEAREWFKKLEAGEF